MQVILTEDVPNLGDMGEVVKVAPGYGRNFLIPKGMALPASNNNAKQLQQEIARIERLKLEQREAALLILKDVDGVSVTIAMRAGDNDKLFGSVTNRDIAQALEQQGTKVDKKQVQLDRALTELGIYQVRVKLASGVHAQIKVWVVAL